MSEPSGSASGAGVTFRAATSADVSAMAHCRLSDPAAGPADQRMAAYFDGLHHPQRALAPRIGYVACADTRVVGYIAGHLTTRHDCAGEIQYLFVEPAHRRQGVATELLRLMARWFAEQLGARRVCVCLDADSPSAQPFYAALGASQLAPNRPLWYVWADIGLLIPGPRHTPR